MYRGLYKSRSVKPKGTYKRSKSKRGGKLPRPQEFASQLQGAMRLKPNGKPQNRFKFEGFTVTKATTLAMGKSGEFLSFKLADLPNSGEIVSMFQRYKITGVTCMVYLASAGTGAPIAMILAPYKANSVATINSGACQMIQGAKWKPLVSSQDLIRCRILHPSPFVAASISSTAPGAGFAGDGTIFCTTDGSNVPHAGFMVAYEGAFPDGTVINYKLNIQYECYDFKVSPTLATEGETITVKAKTLEELGLA